MALTKSEEFAKKIIELAAEEGLTVRELYAAADTAKGMADNSMADSKSIEKTDFPSCRIATCDGHELFTAAQKATCDTCRE